MKYVIALVLALTLNATANLMMKFGVKRFEGKGLSLQEGVIPMAGAVLQNWVLLVGLIFFAMNVVFYTYALSGIKISVAYPIMTGSGFLIVALVAWKFLGETMTPAQWTGVAAIMIGLWLVARDMTTVTS